MNTDLQIDVTDEKDPIEVRFSGVLTRRTVTVAFQRLEPVIRLKRPTVFEMSGISSIDSAGLALVANGIRTLGNGGRRLYNMNADALRFDTALGVDIKSSYFDLKFVVYRLKF